MFSMAIQYVVGQWCQPGKKLTHGMLEGPSFSLCYFPDLMP